MAGGPGADEEDMLFSRGMVLAALAAGAVSFVLGVWFLPPAAAIATALLAFAMMLITLTDLRHYIIPDVVSFPAVVIGVIANIVVLHPEEWTAGLSESLLGIAFGAGGFFLVRVAYFWLRGAEGLGLGDVKLAAVAGAWLGPVPLASVCLAASAAAIVAVLVLAVIPGRRIYDLKSHLPFGSFIAPIIFIFWLYRMPELLTLW